jgi:exodeoxyribonuclease VII large subunit
MPNFPAPSSVSATGGEVLSVSALNRLAREALEARFPLLWVAGEISNLTRAPSGHLYFTLKDEAAQVRCAMWRNRAQVLPFQPAHGMRVEARALVTLYEPRGDYQLNVEALRPAGQGNLAEAFQRLKERLAAEGLFEPARKRPLPAYPQGIGLVTSPQAAALGDVLAALRRRAPHLPVVLYPAPVQGDAAPPRLIAALGQAAARAGRDGIDLLLLVRGGGSLEDLWAFNDEALARAIAACPLPVICGVGHETDFTIADFVADLRAATPTAAAELATAGFAAATHALPALRSRLTRAAERRLVTLAQRLDRTALRLVHPQHRLAQAATRLEHLAHRLGAARDRHLDRSRSRLASLAWRLAARRPELAHRRERLTGLAERLQAALTRDLARRGERLEALGQHLAHLNPEAVLERGYGIVRDAEGRILRRAEQTRPGSPISVQLAQGRLEASVTACRD